jgi:quinoprotein glucose dehydrogenase
VADGHQAVWSVLATDCDFGPDGGFYVSDWVEGWGLTGKGRIYRFADPEAAKKPEIAEVKKRLAEGFHDLTEEALEKLLSHADMRVRQEAQFELASRGERGLDELRRVAAGKDRLARLHAIWGLGQMLRREGGWNKGMAAHLTAQLSDSDPEIRAQAIRALEPDRAALPDFLKLLKDPEPRVRFYAALALRPVIDGQRLVLRYPDEFLAPVRDFLRDNADKDAMIRHAGAAALTSLPPKMLAGLAKDESPSVRLAAVIALRKLRDPAEAAFLDDADPRVRTEAARAIHDGPIPDALPALAALVEKPNQPEFFLWRALNSNFRLGGEKNAAAVAKFAANPAAPEKLRAEAVKLLGLWANPGRRDRVTGLTQDLGKRDSAVAAEALEASLGAVFSGPNAVRREAARSAVALGIKEVGPALFDMAADTKRPAAVRVEMLRALDALNDSHLEKATRLALHDNEPLVRAEGRRLLAKLNPEQGVAALTKALADGTLVERQSALAVLGDLKNDAAATALGQSLDRLLAKDYPPEQTLDLLEASAKQSALKAKLAQFEASRAKDDPLSAYRESLVGGDAEAGRTAFFANSEVSCVKCHKVKGEGGDVGPDLAGIGGKQKRDYLLESIVDPNKQIAQGFETVVLTLTNGKVVSGIVKAEDAKEVRLMTPEGQLVTVPKAKIDERARGKSAMPEDVVKHLSKRELRDLVEFLANLK